MDHDNENSRDTSLLEGRYANYFEVGHNAFEFLLDFGQFYPDRQQARLYTRIITYPIYAKAMLKTLGESLERYEQTFGAIQDR
jgi:Protein of unknown function (DUF3467)